jgi:hypothetical protein
MLWSRPFRHHLFKVCEKLNSGRFVHASKDRRTGDFHDVHKVWSHDGGQHVSVVEEIFG